MTTSDALMESMKFKRSALSLCSQDSDYYSECTSLLSYASSMSSLFSDTSSLTKFKGSVEPSALSQDFGYSSECTSLLSYSPSLNSLSTDGGHPLGYSQEFQRQMQHPTPAAEGKNGNHNLIITI